MAFHSYSRLSERLTGHGHDLTNIISGICPSAANAIGFNLISASDTWCRCRKRNYAVSIKRLFDAIERRGDIGRRVAALVLPISYRPRVTSSCAGKIGLREPGEHTGGPNLASRDNVAHNPPLYIRFWKRRHRSLQRQSIALLSLPGCPCPAGPLVPLAASNKISVLPASSLQANTCRISCIYPCGRLGSRPGGPIVHRTASVRTILGCRNPNRRSGH